MNILDYRTGRLKIGKRLHDLTKMQSEVLYCLSDNELKTYTEIYNYLYNVNLKEISCTYTRSINAHICRLRKLGLVFETKYKYGMRLISKICVQR